jgi:CelD/BcsL family acetyltransferase involved in cellulose biosynthesis
LEVDVVRPEDLGAAEIERWHSIQRSDPLLGSPFLSPAFATAVGRVRPATRVAILRERSSVVGFLAFERGRRRRATALAPGLSDVQGVVAPTTAGIDLGAVIRACGLSALRFDHVLAQQAPWMRVAAHRVVAERSPIIDVSDGWAAYERAQRAVSSSVLRSTARKRRKLERDHGPVRLAFDEPDHGLLDQVMRWKSDQYRRTGRRDRFNHASTRRLMHDLLELRDPGFGAPLTVVRAGDAVVAGHFGLRAGRTLAWWFPVYDPRFGNYSPGLLACVELVRAMPAEGLTLLDLGKGDEPYKDRLSNGEIPLLRGFVARDAHTARVEHARHAPQERAVEAVLRSPTLRRIGREALRRAGTMRERAARLGARGRR